MTLGDEDSDRMLAEAEGNWSKRPWYQQAWFTKIVAPILTTGIVGFGGAFWLLKSSMIRVQRTAQAASAQAQENEEQLEDVEEGRRKFEKKVIRHLEGLQADTDTNSKKLDALREDVREHRDSHH